MTREADEIGRAAAVDRRWYGEFELPPGHWRRWRVGPLELTVGHGEGEWRVWDREVGSLDAADAVSEPLTQAPVMPEQIHARRFVTADGADRLELSPRMPDRAVVARPLEPVFIPGGETVRVFVTVPVFLAVWVDDRPLCEIPAHRPSDTWFGPSNVEGEVCYALRTRCRLGLEGQGVTPPYRAIVAVTVQNRDLEPLALQRLKVPVPLLGVHADAEGRLWTEAVTMVQESGGEAATLHLAEGVPTQAGRVEQLSPARETAPRRTMIRALGALFGS
ncbi:MAG: hypothetical protein PVH31_00695 [Ectothiorhodospiraceae bacterium]|jgi:hypothetical protein